MNKIKILLILIVLFISVSAVSAEGNFTALNMAIKNSSESIDLTQDYTYDNTTDYILEFGINIRKSNFTINGNGHTIDGANHASIFDIRGHNVTLKNLNIINGISYGGVIQSRKFVTFENITFINNTAKGDGVLYCSDGIIRNCNFINNHAENGIISAKDGKLDILGSTFMNTTNLKFSIIYAKSKGELNIEDCIFLDSQAKYATAVYSTKNTTINRSVFKNLSAELTGGALAFKGENFVIINNTLFSNIKAGKDGGAIFNDFRKNGLIIENVTIENSSAEFGGAICHLGGFLNIKNSKFQENTATYDGGAIYTTCADFELKNSEIIRNKIMKNDYSNGGGIYLDNCNYTNINNNIIANNTKNGLYLYDCDLNINNTIFEGNCEAIHGVFLNYNMDNVTLINNTLNLNNTNYITSVEEPGSAIELINNNITVKDLPTRFDSRDWGWVTPVKNQGKMGSCWTFGTVGALESALLKSTGISYNLSENNVQNSMLQYSKYGRIGAIEGGRREQGLFYLLSWMGIFPEEYDTYDELGKISPFIYTGENLHIQDAIFVPPRNNFTDNTKLKEAIIRCGSVTTGFFVGDDTEMCEINGTIYQTSKNRTSHMVTLVGWDDNFSAEKFGITPPGDGAFIIKNSWGTDSGKDGYWYISYYDTSLLNTTFGIGFILENNEKYTKNYQTDLGGEFDKELNITGYKITYKSTGHDLISAVGTYFKDKENYTLEIYVNDKLMHTQNGIAPYYGYHTVKLTKEIPVKENDTFTAVMKKATYIPIRNSRQKYEANTTFIAIDNEWVELICETATLKVYTKELTIFTDDLVKIYKNESQFHAFVLGANQPVIFEINGVNYTRMTSEYGVATMNINLRPGDYVIRTTFNGTTVENTIKVLPTLIAENLVKYFRNESQFYISLINGTGNAVPGVIITMNINGVFYNRTTNENGTAKLNINLNPGTYILTAVDPLTGLIMSYNITVLPTLTADDINMTYLDGTQFKAKLVDGQGKALSGVYIRFNINGVFYNRTTDENGIARLNIRLMPGEYIITSQYGPAITSNKITIVAKED